MTDLANRPAPADLAATEFKHKRITLFDLFKANAAAGQAVIADRLFDECYIEGPAVMLALEGVTFDGCDLGYSAGDVRNLLLRPVSPSKVIGAIALRNCRFVRCNFFAIGFTGSPSFLEVFQQQVATKPAKPVARA